MSSNKKTMIISVVAIAIFIIGIAAASYAFYTAKVSQNGENGKASGTTAKLSTTYEDDGVINITNMIPGDSFTRTFSLENNGADISYKIVVQDLVNEFTSYEDIIFTLKENDTVLKENAVFPNDATKNELSETRTLKSGETRTYTLTITYKNTETDQADDMGKTISGKLFIKEL